MASTCITCINGGPYPIHDQAPGRIMVLHDPIAEKLDEIADMGEWWRKHRDKGRMPSGIRAGMMVLCEEIMAIKQSGIGQ